MPNANDIFSKNINIFSLILLWKTKSFQALFPQQVSTQNQFPQLSQTNELQKL